MSSSLHPCGSWLGSATVSRVKQFPFPLRAEMQSFLLMFLINALPPPMHYFCEVSTVETSAGLKLDVCCFPRAQPVLGSLREGLWELSPTWRRSSV